VKVLGFSAERARLGFLCVAMYLLLACSQPTGKEFFCENYSQGSTINVYRQQIVRLTEQEICVAWPIDALQCAKVGEPTMTKWLEGTDTTQQMRARLHATFSPQQVSLDVFPFVREKGNLSDGVAAPTEQMQFIFRPSDESLQLSFGELGQKTISFGCKPWVKQKWWSVY